MQNAFRIGTAALALALAFTSLFTTGEIGYAEYIGGIDTLPALERAVRLTPENAYFHARIAMLDPGRGEELKRALVLDRNEPSWWIMLSVLQEQAGDPRAAEHSLRQSTQVCDYFVPWWSLAAFYYRQQDAGNFIPAARHALSVDAGDARSIFRMAENLKMPPDAVGRQLVPDLAKPLQAWVDYVLGEHNAAAALSAELRLTSVGSAANLSGLLATCEALFLAGRANSAVMLWNSAIQKHWMEMTLLDPASGMSLNDGTFSHPRLQAGFDWKLSAPDAVEVTQLDQGGVRFKFDGRQPESCELLSQYVPVLPRRKYQLRTRFRTQGIPPESGLRWAIPATPQLSASFPSFSSDTSAEQVVSFETPSEPTPFRLVLSYSRLPGTTRIEGELSIESVGIQLLPAGGAQ
jgi:hypothetical protein